MVSEEVTTRVEDKIELAIILSNGYTDVIGRFEPEEAERYLKENADQQFAWRWVCEECEIELAKENEKQK